MYEISFNGDKLFEIYKEQRKIYPDGVYDFTFEHRFLIYHCHNQGDLVYIAFDSFTGLSSEVVRRNTSRTICKSDYFFLIQLILKSIKYTGDKRYVSAPNIVAQKPAKPRDAITEIFKSIMPKFGFKVREEQVRLSKVMYEAMTNKRIGLCEAEVGTGKTLAYLVAAIIARKQLDFNEKRKPITISTSSIELQKAIIEKDIPLLSDMLLKYGYIYKPLVAVLRKGKEHYVCKRRFSEFFENISRHPKKYKKLIDYFTQTEFEEKGLDLDSTDLPPAIKDRICVKGSCANCRYARRCNYYNFKDNATVDAIDVQITNHNLYLVSRKREGEGLLQDSCIVVIDEAHKFKDAALDIFGTRISSVELKSFLNIVKDTVSEEELPDMYNELIKRIRKANYVLSAHLAPYAKSEEDEEEKPLLIELKKYETKKIDEIINGLKDLDNIRRYMPFEYKNWCSRLIERFEAFKDETDLNIWVEKDENGNVELCSSNKNIADIMYKHLWSKHIHHVLTSGTMSDGESFEFFKMENGLDKVSGKRIAEKRTPSPFNYEEHTRMYIPEDMPLPQYDETYSKALADQIIKLVKATNGHTAVLFTSYKALKAIHDLTKDALSEYEIFEMTKGSSNIIADFKNSKNGVIFASGTMWEGVDCAGDSLSSVIITRLPFPLRTANMEYKRNGCTGLREFVNKYALPEMIIKLRQGVGRLIRNENDTGVVSILDSRAACGFYSTKVSAVLDKYPRVDTISDVYEFMKAVKPESYFANQSSQTEV